MVLLTCVCLKQIPLLVLMVGAMVYHGMPGFVTVSRRPASSVVVPKAEVEVPGGVVNPEVQRVADAPLEGGVAAV
jgi:hypothetical protein